MGNEWRCGSDLPQVTFWRSKEVAEFLAETTDKAVVRVAHNLWAVRPRRA